jgi:hypothetical protein
LTIYFSKIKEYKKIPILHSRAHIPPGHRTPQSTPQPRRPRRLLRPPPICARPALVGSGRRLATRLVLLLLPILPISRIHGGGWVRVLGSELSGEGSMGGGNRGWRGEAACYNRRDQPTAGRASSSVSEWRGGWRLVGGAPVPLPAAGGQWWQGQSGSIEPGLCLPSPQILHVQAFVCAAVLLGAIHGGLRHQVRPISYLRRWGGRGNRTW